MDKREWNFVSMNRKIKLKDVTEKYLFIIFNIVSFGVLLLRSQQIFQKEYEGWMGGFVQLLIMSVVVQVGSLFLMQRKEAYISIFFLVAAYFFHFSHVVLIYVGYDFGALDNMIPFKRHGIETTMHSMGIAWLFIYGVYWGVVLALLCNIGIRVKKYKLSLGDLGQEAFGMFLICISAPFFLYRTVLFIIAVSQNGYAYAANLEYSMYVTMLSNMMMPGVILWMTQKNISRKKMWGIFLFGVGIRGVAMLTGQRAYNLMYIFVLIAVFIYFFYGKKIKTRHWVMAALGGYILCALLAAIRIVRVNGMSVLLIIKAMVNFKDNPILNVMSEFGITGNIVAYTYKMSEEPLGGLQVLSSFASVVPGISYIFPDVEWSELNVIEALDAWNWGGSFVADFYFDLGYYGIILCVVWGFIFQKWSGKFVKELIQKNMYVIAWMTPILCEMFFCVRSTTYKLPRMCVYYSIIYLGFVILFAVLKNFFIVVEKKND